MKKTDISKAELLKQRKERKQQKKAEKRKKKIIRFTVKLTAMLFVASLLYVGVFSWVCGDNPYCDESNTYEYTAKCVDVEVKRKYSRGVFYIRTIYLEDGNLIPIPEKFFDGANENDIIGKNMTFRIYEKLGSMGEIIAEISDEDGNKYLTFEEYNQQASDVIAMFTVISVVVALIICISAVSLWHDS
jgi:uncharacterized membrane protein